MKIRKVTCIIRRNFAGLALKMAGNLGPPHLGNLLNALLGGLASRTWDGKETLLKAIAAICTNCK